MDLNRTGLNRMSLDHPGVSRLALTLILSLGSTVNALGDGLIPEDIAFNPTQNEQPMSAAEAVSDEATDNESTPTISTTGTPDSIRATAQITKPGAPKDAPVQNCSQNPELHKSLTIGSFTRVDPQTSNPGNLYEVEQGVAQLFRQHMSNHPIINPQLLPLGAGNSLDEYQQKYLAQQISRRMGTQFVLQGSIVDMSMDDVDSLYNPGLYDKVANLFYDLRDTHTNDKRQRQFVFNMELRDGYTGEALLTKTYRTAGIWSLRKSVGFNSAIFRNSDYARQIDTLIKQASKELAQTISCQPFIASIDAASGRNQVLLAGGANNGLHAGDQLELYQLIVSPSNAEYMRTETRLVKRNTRVQLSEVYPSHSTAILPDGEYLNGAFLAVSD